MSGRSRWIWLVLLLAAQGARAASVLSESPWLRVGPRLGEPAPALEALQLAPERESTLQEQNTAFTDLLWRSQLSIGADGVIEDRVTIVRRFLTKPGTEWAGN